MRRRTAARWLGLGTTAGALAAASTACARSVALMGAEPSTRPADATAAHGSPATRGTAVSASRLARLTRGVNLSQWLAQTDVTPTHVATWFTADDAARLASAGIQHVRVPVDPELLLVKAAPETLNPDSLRLLDGALDLLLRYDLSVVIDLHPVTESPFLRQLHTEPRFTSTVATLWHALAQHLSQRTPERVFLEVLNEPQVADPVRWMCMQQQLLAAMRQGAPAHTLIATAAGWSTVDDVVALTPAPDRNVAYPFHFYEPTTFTHQGATWADNRWPQLRGLPYPSSPEAVEAALAGAATVDPRARALAQAYGQERWSLARITERLARAASWGRQQGVPVLCNEFGVYRLEAPPESRIDWLQDVRQALESFGVGWTMWDYAAGFGLAEDRGGVRAVDAATVRALGL